MLPFRSMTPKTVQSLGKKFYEAKCGGEVGTTKMAYLYV